MDDVTAIRKAVLFMLMLALACGCREETTGQSGLKYPKSWPLSFISAPPGAAQVSAEVAGMGGFTVDGEPFSGGGGINGRNWSVAFTGSGGIAGASAHLEQHLKAERWLLNVVHAGERLYYSPDFLWGARLLQIPGEERIFLEIKQYDSSAAHLPKPSQAKPIN